MFYHYAGNNPVRYTDPTGEYTTYGVLLAGVCYVGAAACCCIAVASAGTGQIYITPGATLVALFLVSAGGTILAADANNVNYAKSNHKEHGKSKGKPEAKPADEPSPVPKDGVNSGKQVDEGLGSVLDGAKPGRETKGHTRQWDKPGSMDDANDDFDSLNPENVKDIPGGRTGTLPDGRKVNVRDHSSDGRPTLEVQNGKNRIKVRYGEGE